MNNILRNLTKEEHQHIHKLMIDNNRHLSGIENINQWFIINEDKLHLFKEVFENKDITVSKILYTHYDIIVDRKNIYVLSDTIDFSKEDVEKTLLEVF